MQVHVHPTADAANAAAARCLAAWLTAPGVRNGMFAAGQSPLELYRRIGDLALPLAHLHVFALDEYVGVPDEEPRNCAHLIRRSVIEPWGIPPDHYFPLRSHPDEAAASLAAHERRIDEAGGLDVLVLGLGQNGHLGFNEPGSDPSSPARVLDLAPISVEANRRWFSGDYAPARGATIGLRTLLAARRILLLAFGSHKSAAVRAMRHGPRSPDCPASFLQDHPGTEVFLDAAAHFIYPPRSRLS